MNLPPIAEQRRVATALDRASNAADEMLDRARRAAELVREMRLAHLQEAFGSMREVHERLNPHVGLGGLISLSVGRPGADFYIQRSGGEGTVGRPFREAFQGPGERRLGPGDPKHHIGVTVLKPDLLDPRYLFYVAEYAWRSGIYKRLCHGTLRLQHLRLRDVSCGLNAVLSGSRRNPGDPRREDFFSNPRRCDYERVAFSPYKGSQGKKRTAVFSEPGRRTVHFGAQGYEDYTMHQDPERRRRYLGRHGRGREDWDRCDTAGSLSRWVLWGDSTDREANERAFRRRFGLGKNPSGRNPVSDRDRYRFVTDCIHSTGGDIGALVDGATKISQRTFRSKLAPGEWQILEGRLGYDRHLPLSRDQFVGYFKSTYRGVPAVFMTWSGIEQVFTLDGKQGPSADPGFVNTDLRARPGKPGRFRLNPDEEGRRLARAALTGTPDDLRRHVRNLMQTDCEGLDEILDNAIRSGAVSPEEVWDAKVRCNAELALQGKIPSPDLDAVLPWNISRHSLGRYDWSDATWIPRAGEIRKHFRRWHFPNGVGVSVSYDAATPIPGTSMHPGSTPRPEHEVQAIMFRTGEPTEPFRRAWEPVSIRTPFPLVPDIAGYGEEDRWLRSDQESLAEFLRSAADRDELWGGRGDEPWGS
jgi:hypothetical protein